MPKYKNSCGCYNKHDARTIGLVPAIVWNDMLDRSEHFESNPMWYDQKDAAERLGIPERTLYRAVDTLVEAGRITKKKGYRPGTTTTTTWVTINENYIVAVPGTTDLAVPRNDDLAVPILKETKERDSQGVTAKVAYIRVNPSGKAWKSQKVYTTSEEIERLEDTNPEENIEFKFWKSPKFVGDDDKAKTKYTKAKLIQPDVEDEEETVEYNGKKYKTIPGGECY